ncbi:uncharacterized protein Ecym_1460 [Eremothecium cymbalariae DBVPG|uniref:Uncharacterized protein n=1 Tax=Eremothecium cymbalariae (strain CBS 270.75 / DBVPG 7215 / KCTC 17166 / NRRL Y-17582) TaxID=931890 RepID=G8JMG9_ERECY|nr:hypothetical protein Ecym_1460 [Eremothecium cymbalariae DBVPG\
MYIKVLQIVAILLSQLSGPETVIFPSAGMNSAVDEGNLFSFPHIDFSDSHSYKEELHRSPPIITDVIGFDSMCHSGDAVMRESTETMIMEHYRSEERASPMLDNPLDFEIPNYCIGVPSELTGQEEYNDGGYLIGYDSTNILIPFDSALTISQLELDKHRTGKVVKRKPLVRRKSNPFYTPSIYTKKLMEIKNKNVHVNHVIGHK